MNFINLKIIFRSLQKNKFYTILCITGIAFTFIFISMILMFIRTQHGNIVPEVNKDKTISINKILLENGNSITVDSAIVKYYTQLRTPEYIAHLNIQSPDVYNGKMMIWSPIGYTNSDIFKIFEFKFLAGRPFTDEEVENKTPVLVATKEYAESFFGKTDVLGENIEIQGTIFNIIGIIEGPSNISTLGQYKLYIPYTFNKYMPHPGRQTIFLTAKDIESVPTMSDEINRLHQQLFAQGSIDSKPVNTDWKSMKDSVGNFLFISMSVIIIILLLIPAFNIISLNTGKILDQMVELSLKRVYGASRRTIFYEIFKENTIVTIIGAFLGLSLTPVLLHAISIYISSIGVRNMKLVYTMSIDIYVIAAIFLLILIFSLISCFVPALKVMNSAITEELKGGKNG